MEQTISASDPVAMGEVVDLRLGPQSRDRVSADADLAACHDGPLEPPGANAAADDLE